jgi:hypothetical protein
MISHLYDPGTGNRRNEYIVESLADGARKRVELKQACGLTGPKMLDRSPDAVVPLLLNRSSGEVRFDDENPRINFKAYLKAQSEEKKSGWDKALEE